MPNYYNGMPYNGWYSQFYQSIQPPMQLPVMQNQPQVFPGQSRQQMQGGFVRVQSEQEARAYPVAPGTSITFIDENAPYCYTKSVDISQLDRPKFERYRLVKEEDPAGSDAPVSLQNAPQATMSCGGNNDTEYALKSDLVKLTEAVEVLRRKVEAEGVREDA